MKGYNARYVWTISAVAALGGLLFGYDWVVIGGAKPFYERCFQLNGGHLVGWANSCALLGCLLGSIAAGGLSERLGRKKLLILSAFLFAISSVLTGWAPAFTWFVVWRIVGGVAIGMASNVSPMYIAEISPAAWRGRLVSLNQLTIVVGILGAQIVNWLIAQPVPESATDQMIRDSWNGQFGWRWMFTAVAVPSVVFFVSAFFVPESPRWLVEKGRHRSRPPRAGAHRRRRVCRFRRGRNPRQHRRRDARAACRTAHAGHAAHSRNRRRAGRAPAMERHQRDLQLRRGDLPRRGLQRQRHPVQHRDHGRHQSGVHLCGARLRGPHRPARTDAGGLRRNRRVAHPAGPGLSFRTQGHPRAGAHAVHHRLLRDVAGAGDVGADLGNLPQSHARRGGFDCGFGVVDRLLRADLYVPRAECGRWVHPAPSGSMPPSVSPVSSSSSATSRRRRAAAWKRSRRISPPPRWAVDPGQARMVYNFRRCLCTNRTFRRAWRDVLFSPWRRPFPPRWRRPSSATGPTSSLCAIPDPDIVALDKSFAKYQLFNAVIYRHFTRHQMGGGAGVVRAGTVPVVERHSEQPPDADDRRGRARQRFSQPVGLQQREHLRFRRAATVVRARRTPRRALRARWQRHGDRRQVQRQAA